ncbi:hypothetical protein Glove_182g20 [Diversispora epigaea]|uniref:Uncharacterized protein n=1 Tax=Diversispora epigaea TaxID=1348612 RepID=A0A397IW53_9GLOM|nr:hypothetical protein Glove_182g20 [Diversispora epigaea]
MNKKKTNVCPECNQEYGNWCKPCNTSHLINGQCNIIAIVANHIQLNANDDSKVGDGIIYYAKSVDRHIKRWDIKNQQWLRDGGEVALKNRTKNDYKPCYSTHFNRWTSGMTLITKGGFVLFVMLSGGYIDNRDNKDQQLKRHIDVSK